ncbi:hypothetical protein CBS101457_000681 [Exobasidium rhododendri]|nr:hypothetical protein CBS101457_000681 [Exobasidium rhododendri]
MTSTCNENAFMADLLADLDASIFSETPTPIKTRSSSSQPVSITRGCSKSPQISITARQTEGALLNASHPPSPRKRAIKKIKYESDRVTTSQRKRKQQEKEEEIRTATEAILSCTDDWEHDLRSSFSSSQGLGGESRKKQRMSAIGGVDRRAFQEERYTRCVVKSVVLDHYIPAKYLKAAPGRHSTKGVLPETVKSAMQSRQKVIYVCDLKPIELSSEDGKHNGKLEEGKERRLILRSDWYNTAINEGDVIHLIGKWKDEEGGIPTTSMGHQRIEVDLDDPDEALWNEMEELPNHSQSSSTSLIPTMILGGLEADLEANNLLILHPDVLLSATAISTVVRCTRRAYLQSKLKASGPANEEGPSESLLMGRMLHEVLQSCLTGRPKECRSRDVRLDCEDEASRDGLFPMIWKGPTPTNFSLQFVKEQIQSQVQSGLEDILCAGIDTQTAIDRLWESAIPFGQFASRYLVGDDAGRPKKEAEGHDKGCGAPQLVLVKKVLDVEEDIWSPMYGLKGFVDVSVEVEIANPIEAEGTLKRNNETIVMPLELKTGRSVDMIQHQAQTILYNLMMSDRYHQKIDTGLLYYSKTSTLHLVRSLPNDVKALIIARNELAEHVYRKSGKDHVRGMLPASIDRERDCGKCYVSKECMLYRRAIERVPVMKEEREGEALSSIAAIYNDKVQHLTPRHAEFFSKWERLLSLEEDDIVRFRRELWTMTAQAREASGRCLADMVLTKEVKKPMRDEEKRSRTLSGMNDRIVYHFCKADQAVNSSLGEHFSVGDLVTISLEPNIYSIAQGHVLDITPHLVTLTLDRDLRAVIRRHNKKLHGARPLFRIDKEEFASGMARIRYNLAKMFFASPYGDSRRRALVVDLERPRFAEVDPFSYSLSSSEMNEDQQRAVKLAMSAQDYALIVGMPGTGKTTTIVQLIKELIKKGKSILLTSYTHSAVDTICRKLVQEKSVKLLRIGKTDRIHSDIHAYTMTEAHSVEELTSQILEPNVVATTCLSISHAIFGKRKFDYCIVDEASQITLPTCLGPLRFANIFVLVGDPLQLPPLVKNVAAKEGGLDVSLFDVLQKAYPQSVVELHVQYRMNADIMKLSNELTYDGQLRCGNRFVQDGCLSLPNLRRLRQVLHSPRQSSKGSNNNSSGTSTIQSDAGSNGWIDRVMERETRALFINTDLLSGREETRVNQGFLVNTTEVDVITQLSTALVLAGVREEEIAIITPYRQQLRALVHSLGSAAMGDDKIEVLTVDKAQGRDKDVVIISFVRSVVWNGRHPGREGEEMEGDDFIEGDSSDVGQLLNDVKRINVALTRARKKLIIVGSKSTLARSRLLRRLWNVMHENDWTMDLTQEQLDKHRECLDGVTKRKVHESTHHKRGSEGGHRIKSRALLQGRPVLQDIFNEVM